MRLAKLEINDILTSMVPKIFDRHWIELKDQMTQFVDKLHDREYGRFLESKFKDIDFLEWASKSNTFDIEASGRLFKFYSLAMAPEDFERTWPDAGRRAVWWVSQTLPASEEKYFPYAKGPTLNIKTPGHYASAVSLRLAVMALLDEERTFRLKFREFLSRDMASHENLETRINKWIEDNVKA